MHRAAPNGKSRKISDVEGHGPPRRMLLPWNGNAALLGYRSVTVFLRGRGLMGRSSLLFQRGKGNLRMRDGIASLMIRAIGGQLVW